MARKPAEKNEPDFENTLKQLEEIVSRLENNDLSLEEALKDFEQGIKLAQLGQKHTCTLPQQQIQHTDRFGLLLRQIVGRQRPRRYTQQQRQMPRYGYKDVDGKMS